MIRRMPVPCRRSSPRVSRQVPTADAFLTPQGVASVIGTCATNVDPIRILYGHYPSTYIAWMQAIESDGLHR